MEEKKPFQNADQSPCECCITATDVNTEYGCRERLGVFTLREQKVLARIRELKEKARQIKSKISGIAGARQHDSDVQRLTDELIRLKRERALLEEERVSAAAERMRWLGHA